MNAPGGVVDYCQRYGDGIHNVLHQHSRDGDDEWKPETIESIHNAMRKVNGPLSKLSTRVCWRDQRLNALDQHLRQQQQK